MIAPMEFYDSRSAPSEGAGSVARKYVSGLVAAPAVAGVLGPTSPSSAQAGAAGPAPVQTSEYSVGGATVEVPTGCMCSPIIRGKGKKMRTGAPGVDCGFVGALGGGFCNRRIGFAYADTGNRTYETSRGATRSECEIDPAGNNSPQALPRYGRARAHLYADEVRRRRVGGVAFAGRSVLSPAFFGFLPGLPHVIDAGAVVVPLAVGLFARRTCQSWVARRRGERR